MHTGMPGRHHSPQDPSLEKAPAGPPQEPIPYWYAAVIVVVLVFGT